MPKNSPKLKTWIELSQKALSHNLSAMRSLLPHNGKIWAVIKSNAYGHGLLHIAKLLNEKVDGFCTDSVIEALKLRQQGVKAPILTIGPSIEEMLTSAATEDITLSVSSEASLDAIAELSNGGRAPSFHIKVDTGMHRQGFYPKDLKEILKQIKKHNLPLKGIYSHFAAAKDPVYRSYTQDQFKQFQTAVTLAEAEGFTNLEKHIAATPALMLSGDYTMDFARIGAGLYGIYPSKELEMHMQSLELQPVLSWHTRISEIKVVAKDCYIGYDLGYKTNRKTKAAILPIGYWHGLDKRLSNTGSVLIKGKLAPIIGKISMDITVVDISDINSAVDDEVVLIGQQQKESISLWDHARWANTSAQEIAVSLNPLLKKEIV
ncbi:MAG: alanine racemase [bacterium]|nr:alanine racemase [bacterium]